MERAYAQAIKAQVSKGADESALFSNLIAHLKAKGRVKLLPKILAELRSQEARTRSTEATLEVASEKESENALKAARDLGFDAAKADVNPTLITGWRVRKGGTLVDASGKRTLLDLYRRITS